jgi:hypothetical protein
MLRRFVSLKPHQNEPLSMQVNDVAENFLAAALSTGALRLEWIGMLGNCGSICAVLSDGVSLENFEADPWVTKVLTETINEKLEELIQKQDPKHSCSSADLQMAHAVRRGSLLASSAFWDSESEPFYKALEGLTASAKTAYLEHATPWLARSHARQAATLEHTVQGWAATIETKRTTSASPLTGRVA